MKLIYLIILSFCTNLLFSQDSLNNDTLPENRKKSLVMGSIIGGAVYIGGLTYLTYTNYKDTRVVPFHFINDWKTFLQLDKFQHAYLSYSVNKLGYNWLSSLGTDKRKALIYSGAIGAGVSTSKELIDAFNSGSGFSLGDMAAGFVGSSLFIGQELLFREQVIKYKFSFSRSVYVDQANGFLGNNLFERYVRDFNGHTYWLSMNANKLIFKNELPDWLNFAAGYSANGMFGAFKNRISYNSVLIPETIRYRQFLLSMDIDWTSINTHSRFVSYLFKAMNFIKVPFPAVEINSKGGIRGYWLYF